MALSNVAVLSQRHFPELPSRGQTVLVTWSCWITAPNNAALPLQHCRAFKAAAQCLDESSRSSPWSQQTFGFKSSTCKKTWPFPPVQFLSCSPTVLTYTAALACRQHLHSYTTPSISHGQATHVSFVGSHLRKCGTVSKHLPLKKSFKDIYSKDLFMSEKTRSTEYTMLTQADREAGIETQEQCTQLHRDGSSTECTPSCKAWLSSVVTLLHHQNPYQSQTTCLNLENPDLNRTHLLSISRQKDVISTGIISSSLPLNSKLEI